MAAIITAVMIASTGALAASPASATAPMCSSGYYENSKGKCVKRPTKSSSTPSGATAKCRDGTYSYSQSRSGTCSHHGGVSRWL